MKLLKKLFSNHNFWPLVIVIFVALLAGRTLLTPGYFKMHDDLQMMRQLEMEKCFLDLQIPCRWVPDMGYGFGFPLFNYYPPLPYLVGELFRLVGFSFVDIAKLVFLISFVLSGIAMYFFSKEFFGKVGGILSSIFYIWAPYHAVDVYVRGATNEAWAFIWFPLILLFSYRLIISHKLLITRWIILLSLSWTGLFLSHNLMVLIFTPVFGLWILYFLLREKNWGKIILLLRSGVLALGLTAFFTLPAILEQKYVQVNTLINGYYEYIAHFATFKQLFLSRFWGYGPSAWLENDKMSFQIGHLHWILSLVIGGWWLVTSLKKKKNVIHNSWFIIPFFFVVGWFAAFMAHSRSTFIWQVLPPLKFVQFPWRFLTLVTFSFSFIVGSLALVIPKKFIYWVVGLLSIGLIIFNWNYFLPDGRKMGPLTDKEKFTGVAWDLQRNGGIFDYLPKTAKENPKEGQSILAEAVDGRGEITNTQEGTNWARFSTVNSQPSIVRINIFKYPNWRAFIDGRETEITIPETENWGRMYIRVPEGTHEIYLKLYNTPIRTIGNTISFISWLGFLVFLVRRKKMLQFKRGR